MYRTEGVRGLWKSNVLNCWLAAPFSAFEFFFYEFFKNNLFGNDVGEISLAKKIVAGALTGITAQFLIYPGDVVKTHYITATNAVDVHKVSVTNIAKNILRTEGLKGFYKGTIISSLGCGPFIAIRMSCYDQLMTTFKHRYFTKKQMESHDPKFLAFNCAVGSAAGLLAIMICYPFDVIRRLLHLNKTDPNHNYTGTFDACR